MQKERRLHEAGAARDGAALASESRGGEQKARPALEARGDAVTDGERAERHRRLHHVAHAALQLRGRQRQLHQRSLLLARVCHLHAHLLHAGGGARPLLARVQLGVPAAVEAVEARPEEEEGDGGGEDGEEKQQGGRLGAAEEEEGEQAEGCEAADAGGVRAEEQRRQAEGELQHARLVAHRLLHRSNRLHLLHRRSRFNLIHRRSRFNLIHRRSRFGLLRCGNTGSTLSSWDRGRCLESGKQTHSAGVLLVGEDEVHSLHHHGHRGQRAGRLHLSVELVRRREELHPLRIIQPRAQRLQLHGIAVLLAVRKVHATEDRSVLLRQRSPADDPLQTLLARELALLDAMQIKMK